jgi:hypothetical protein
MLLDPLLRDAPLDDVFAVAPQEVIDGLNPDAYGPGSSVWPRVSTERFCSTMASNSDAISSSGGVPSFCKPLMSVSAKTPHLPATLCSLTP